MTATTRVVRYRTRPECADDNARLVEAVMDELAAAGTEGIRYTVLRLDDGVSFVHVAVIDGPDLDQELNQARAALEQARANLELARISAERWLSLIHI